MSSPIFKVSMLSIFPEIFPGPLAYSLAGQALKAGIWQYELVDIRDFGLTKHKNVDDIPYGGGNGMVMRADVLGAAIDHALASNPNATIIYMSPRGKNLTQALSQEISQYKNIIILCGRFEGIDERIIEEYNIQELSIGDYVLSGGELAALVLLDSCIRLLPGVLENRETLCEESFSILGPAQKPLLEYPLYTRPAEWKGRKVPDILISGDHKKIEDWRYKKSLEITKQRRPDLLK
ncbi:MAG: trmD [Rickettsiaceae bacterium]|jgi:tRNA (guanine37-N1)-methyltransferase|nr:trmD [Rickettsiaceae bacterium]